MGNVFDTLNQPPNIVRFDRERVRWSSTQWATITRKTHDVAQQRASISRPPASVLLGLQLLAHTVKLCLAWMFLGRRVPGVDSKLDTIPEFSDTCIPYTQNKRPIHAIIKCQVNIETKSNLGLKIYIALTQGSALHGLVIAIVPPHCSICANSPSPGRRRDGAVRQEACGRAAPGVERVRASMIMFRATRPGGPGGTSTRRGTEELTFVARPSGTTSSTRSSRSSSSA